MTNNTGDEFVFDANSGISEEEQREILAKINGIAESQRRSLSEGAIGDDVDGVVGKKPRFKAQKSGKLFPMVVNAVAVTALVGGLVALWFFHGKTDAQVREGAKVYNSAERALIDEIRKETASRLEAKESEISLIASKLAEIDAELHGLQSNNQSLSAGQRADQNRLLAMQGQYRSDLDNLHNERSQILEEAREREARLQAQLESRTRELAIVAEQSASAIGLAQGEIERLSREQGQAATVEAQMGAFFANLSTEIYEGRFEEAGETVQAMRRFLNTPAFQGLRSIQARKDMYAQALNSFETMIDEVRRFQAAGLNPPDRDIERTLADLQAQNARLGQDLAERDRTIAAFNSGESGLMRRLTEMDRSVSTLQAANTALEEGLREKDDNIALLEMNLAVQAQHAETARQSVSSLEADVRTLNQGIATRDNTINQLETQNTSYERTIADLNTQLTTIRNALQTLSQ